MARVHAVSKRLIFNSTAAVIELLESRRLLSAGQLDTTFGGAGIVRDNTLPGSAAIAVQADGKVVEATQFLQHISVARFNADGTPDVTFGYYGRLTSDVANIREIGGIALQPDGKILVAANTAPTAIDNGTLIVTRYNPNGSLDAAFGTQGLVTTRFAGGVGRSAGIFGAIGIAVGPDSKIVAAGAQSIDGVVPTNGINADLVRFNGDGSLDATFGAAGTSIVTEPALYLVDMALAPDGKIVLVGGTGGVSEPDGAFITRFNANGTPDHVAFTPLAGSGSTFANRAVAVQADGKVVVGGTGVSGGVGVGVVERFNADGTGDSSFGTAGVVASTTPVYYTDIFAQGDGKIVAGGSVGQSSDDFYLNIVTNRYNANGTPDSTFGTAGSTRVQTLGGTGFKPRLAPGPHSTIVESADVATRLQLLRLTGDATPSGGSISGTVFNDANENGIVDAGDAGLAGQTVYLDIQGIDSLTPTDPVTTTDANGRYSFTGLQPGNYLVRTIAPAFPSRYIAAPLYGGKYFVQLSANQAITGDDFLSGLINTPNIGIKDYFLVEHRNAAGQLTFTRFHNNDSTVDPYYGVFGTITLPASITGDFTGVNGDNGGIILNFPDKSVVISSTGIITSIVFPGTIAAPSQLTAVSVSASHVQLTFQDNSTNERSFIVESSQNPNGPFIFVNSVDGSTDTGTRTVDDLYAVPGTTLYYRVYATTGAIQSAVFGPVAITTPGTGSITGVVYNDLNGNGSRDLSDTPSVGRQVYLDLRGIGMYVAGDPTTFTNSDGVYTFTQLPPANYLVRLVPKAGQIIDTPVYGGKIYLQMTVNMSFGGDDFGSQALGPITAVQVDGKIVAPGLDPVNGDLGIMRYNADGSIDTTFGRFGFFDIPGSAGKFVSAIIIRPDGDIVAEFNSQNPASAIAELVLLDANGALVHGSAIGFYAPEGKVYGVELAVTPDNKILMGATVSKADPETATQRLIRFNPDLSVDNTFGPDGNGMVITVSTLGDSLSSITVLSDGRTVLNYHGPLVVVSATGIIETASPAVIDAGGGFLIGGQTDGNSSVTRYNADGSLDTGFYQHGTAVTSAKGTTKQVLVLPYGAIVLWQKPDSSGFSSPTDRLEFLSSYGWDKTHVDIATSISGNSGNTVQIIDRVFYNGTGVEADGRSIRTTYSFNPNIPNDVTTTPLNSVYFVGYNN